MATNITDRQLCSICLNDFQQPKILDCNHSFCLTCLEDYINKVSTNDQFPCPLCRHICKIPDGGMKELVNDICKVNIPPCDVCKSGVDSEFWCGDCEQYLCKSCRTVHDGLKVLCGHVVRGIIVALETPGGDNAKSTAKDICPNHPKKEVRYYCKDCSVSVCAECFVIGHNGHQFLDLLDEQIKVETRDKLNQLKVDLEARIEQFVKYSDSLKALVTDIDLSADKSLEAVDKQVETICSEVKQLGDDVKIEIQKSRDAEIDKMTKPLKEMEILIEDLKASVKCTVDVIEDKSIVQVLNRIPQVEQEQEECSLRKLDIPDVKYTWFQQSVIDKTLLVNQLGSLENREGPTFKTSFNLEVVWARGECGAYNYIQGLPWCILALHEKKEDTEPTLDIYSYLRKTDTANIKSCQAKCSSTLINIKDKQQSVNKDDDGDPFVKTDRGWFKGWHRFINWNRLSDKQNGFIDDNNNFTIQTTVKAININRG